MQELTIEHYIVYHAKKEKMLVFKMNNAASDGWPDRLFVPPSCKHFWIEFKAPGEKCRRLQSQRIVELIDQHQDVYVVDNREKGIEIISFYKKNNGMEPPPVSRESREAHDSARGGGSLVGSGPGKN